MKQTNDKIMGFGRLPAFITQVLIFVAVYTAGILRIKALGINYEAWLEILFVIISVYAAINFHEIGHLVFGKAAGYRLIAYQTGLFSWQNENGKMKFSVRRIKGMGGYCAMVPPNLTLPFCKHALFYAGGILFNLCFGILLFLLTFILFGISDAWMLLTIHLACLSAAMGLLNLIPFYSGSNASDGLLIWNLVSKNPFGLKMIECNRMIARLSSGTRPGELTIPESIDEGDPFILVSIVKIYGYFKALDCGNQAEAARYAEWFERNIAAFPLPASPAIYYELCYMGCVANNAPMARKYFEKGGKILKKDQDVNGLRIKAYYAYHIENDREKALRLCEKALAVTGKFPVRGQGIMEEALVRNLRDRLVNGRLEDYR